MSSRSSSSSIPIPSAVCYSRSRGLFLATAAATILSSSQVLAFVPQQAAHNHRRQGPISSRLPSSVSYQGPDDSAANGARVLPTAVAATSYPPPAPGRSTTSSNDDDDKSLSSAKSILAARTEEITNLRTNQAEQLTKISELTASLASAHGNAADDNNILKESQADLTQGLETVAKLIADVNDASVKLREVEVLRMEAVAALEDAEGIAAAAAAAGSVVVDVSDAVDEGLDAVDAVINANGVNGNSAATAEAAIQVGSLRPYYMICISLRPV